MAPHPSATQPSRTWAIALLRASSGFGRPLTACFLVRSLPSRCSHRARSRRPNKSFFVRRRPRATAFPGSPSQTETSFALLLNRRPWQRLPEPPSGGSFAFLRIFLKDRCEKSLLLVFLTVKIAFSRRQARAREKGVVVFRRRRGFSFSARQALRPFWSVGPLESARLELFARQPRPENLRGKRFRAGRAVVGS